jgi:ABC-type transport system substrate-binding protein
VFEHLITLDKDGKLVPRLATGWRWLDDRTFDGLYDWIGEQAALRQFDDQVLGTVGRERQQALIRQMERHTRDQAYFLFLYNPILLYATNNAVRFVLYANGILNLSETAVTEQHWSVRK